MKSFGFLAASALVGVLVSAAPVNKRDVVWVTETDIDIVTIPITKTVWVDGSATSTDAPVSTTVQANAFHPSRTHAPVSVTPSSSVGFVETSSSSSVSVAPTTSIVEPTTSTSPYVPSTTSTSEYVPSTTSTSAIVEPTTTSTSAVAEPTTTEAPTSTYVASTTLSTFVAAAAATTSASSGSDVTGMAAPGTSYTGDLTWYEVGLGSCGLTSVASDSVVAISHVIMDAYSTGNPNTNPLCGKSVTITGVSGEKYTAQVVDRCVGCAEGDLDLSEDFFNTVTNNGDGRVHDITWDWA